MSNYPVLLANAEDYSDINKAVIALYQKVKKWCAVNYANVEVGKSFSHTGTNYGAGND